MDTLSIRFHNDINNPHVVITNSLELSTDIFTYDATYNCDTISDMILYNCDGYDYYYYLECRNHYRGLS